MTGDDITWMSSPFLRCLQTSHEAIDAFQKLGGRNDLTILPEYSVFEWDGHNGKLHKSLPDLGERKHYFPRVDVAYESLFIPDLPEPRTEFHSRCQRGVQAINHRYRFRPGTALIVVSHAAGCVGLSAAATNQTLASITPAAPCSVYRMTRTSDTPVWNMDAHDAVNSMNGHTAHLSDMGSSAMPWNNFGNKKIFRGYTGPATSRFAPQGFASREELLILNNHQANPDLPSLP